MMRIAAVLLAGLLATGSVAAEDTKGSSIRELKPPHSARISFDPLDGSTGPIAPEAAFGITVEVVNHAGTDAPAGLTLFSWLRRIDASNLPCTESAESFFRTGRLPVGAVFLNDPLVAMLTEDDVIHLVDPEFSLATANILAALRLSSRPGTVVADPDRRRLLITLPEEGRIVAVDTAARETELAADLTRPEAVIPTPDGGVIALDAGLLLRRPEGKVPTMAVRALVGVQGFPEALAFGTDDVVLFDRATGEVVLHWSVQADVAIPLSGQEGVFGVAAASGNDLFVRYLDAPDDPPHRIMLASPASKMVQSRDGRFLFAHDPRGGPVSVIDLALSRVVQTTDAGDTAVSEIVLGESGAYLMLADQSRIGVLDLVSLARSGHAEFREVPLGTKSDPPITTPGYLASLWPDSGVFAVHRENRQGYRLQDYAAMGNAPPMSAIPLRGGMARAVYVLDRSFREGPTGTFSTVTSLPGPGRWELVATTGIGQLSFCAEVPVADPGDPAPETGSLIAVRTATTGMFQLRALSGAGDPLKLRGIITFAALSGAWRDRIRIETDDYGLSLRTFQLPSGDPVVMTLETGAAARFAPLFMEDTQ